MKVEGPVFYTIIESLLKYQYIVYSFQLITWKYVLSAMLPQIPIQSNLNWVH